jgi:predicted ferric reductase
MKKFVLLDFQTSGIQDLFVTHKWEMIFIFLFIILHVISYKNTKLVENISKLPLKYWTVFITIIMTLILLFFDGSPEDFIYFKF